MWNLHHRTVLRACLGWLAGRRDDADEAYGRIAVRALERCPPSFRDTEHARAWLLAIARNVCMDIHRERTRGREVSMDADASFVEPVAKEDPESRYLVRERDRHLRALLGRLPARLRRTVELHVFSDMASEDVARELGITVSNVRKRMQEVRSLLRRVLERGAPAAALPADDAPPECAPETHVVTPVVLTACFSERDAELVLPVRGRRERDIDVLERYCAKHPRGWRRRLDLARAYVTAGRAEEAIAHYQYAIGRQPYPLDAWLELGAVLDACGQRGDAIAVYEAGAHKAGKKSARQHLAALAEARRGNVDAAVQLLTTAADGDFADARHARALGALCNAAGRPFDAVGMLERALMLDPADPLAPSLLHDALMDAGRPLAARAVLEQAFARCETNVPVLERLVAARSRAGKDDVHALAASLLRLAPERGRAHAAVAQAALRCGREAEAEARLLIYCNRHPRHAQAWLALGELHLSCERFENARDAVSHALTLDPDGRDIWRALCRVAASAGDASLARRVANAAARRFARDAILLRLAASAAVAAGERPLALELCGRAVALQPEIASLHFAYAVVLADAGDDDAAVRRLECGARAVPADDGHDDGARIALLLAELHQRLGNGVAAEAWALTAAARAEAGGAELKIHCMPSIRVS